MKIRIHLYPFVDISRPAILRKMIEGSDKDDPKPKAMQLALSLHAEHQCDIVFVQATEEDKKPRILGVLNAAGDFISVQLT